MIAFVRGQFVYKTPTVVHIEAHGVGYELHISLHTYSHIQSLEKGLLYTHLHIKEDAHTLYGFAEVAEKELFLQLISVSGVGAATARMMLSSLKPDELARAIVQGNTKQLESIKGIGKKSAERRSEEHTSELQSPCNLVCRLLLAQKSTERSSHGRMIPHPLL